MNYLAASMSVQGCFGDGRLSGTVPETSIFCVEGFVSSSRVVANSVRISNPRCFGVEVCESFIFNLRGLSCLYILVFSFM
jgi:hypothetical protein